MVRTTAILLVATLTFGMPTAAEAQPQISEKIFELVSKSVFLIEMLDQTGAPVSSGTAFIVGPRRLLTNAHVVAEGSCRIRLSNVRLACAVERMDRALDLALLTTDSDLLAAPLKIVPGSRVAGTSVYVVSNPAGLERTISQGLLSERRVLDGVERLQFSAPVSPGSSGGPLVNANGEVVGVVVESLRAGQLLNFAIPGDVATGFLTNTIDLSTYAAIKSRLAQLRAEMKSLRWSAEAGSPWQQNEQDRRVLVQKALPLAKLPSDLLDLSAEARYLDSEIAITAARRANSGKTAPDASLLLAELLVAKANLATAATEKVKIASEALTHAGQALLKLGESEARLFVLASAHEILGNWREVYSALTAAAELPDGKSERVLAKLTLAAVELKRPGDAKKWLSLALADKNITDFDLYFLPDVLEKREQYSLAGMLWDRFGQGSPSSYCSAARMWWLADDLDEALGSARLCTTGLANDPEQSADRAYGHRVIGTILFDRGVYDEALTNARAAVDLDKTDGWSFHMLSKVLERLDRNLEAIDAAKTALRLTDGRFATIHFALGSAYFNLDRWEEARTAFETAARLDPKDASAAFNIAVSLMNAKQRSQAVYWLEETLRRNPSPETKTRADGLLRTLR